MNCSSESTHRNDKNIVELNILDVAENSANNGNNSDAVPLHLSVDLKDPRKPGVGVSGHLDLEVHITPDVRVDSPQAQSCCGCCLVLLSSLLYWMTTLWNRLVRYFFPREGITESFCKDVTSNANVSFTPARSPAGGSGPCSILQSNGGPHPNIENQAGFSFISSSESNGIPSSTQEPGLEVPGVTTNLTKSCSSEQGQKLDKVDLSNCIFSILVDQSLDREEIIDTKQSTGRGGFNEKPSDQIFVQESEDCGSVPATFTAEIFQDFSSKVDDYLADDSLSDDSLSGDDSDSDTIVGSMTSLYASQISSLDRCSSLKDFDKFSKRVSDIDFAALRNEGSAEPRSSLPGRRNGSLRNSPRSSEGTRNSGGTSRKRLQKVLVSRGSSESNDGLSSFSFGGTLSRIVEHNCGLFNAEEVVLRQNSKDSRLERRRLPSVIAPKEAMTKDSKPYSRKSFQFSTPAKPGELLIG